MFGNQTDCPCFCSDCIDEDCRMCPVMGGSLDDDDDDDF